MANGGWIIWDTNKKWEHLWRITMETISFDESCMNHVSEIEISGIADSYSFGTTTTTLHICKSYVNRTLSYGHMDIGQAQAQAHTSSTISKFIY